MARYSHTSLLFVAVLLAVLLAASNAALNLSNVGCGLTPTFASNAAVANGSTLKVGNTIIYEFTGGENTLGGFDLPNVWYSPSSQVTFVLYGPSGSQLEETTVNITDVCSPAAAYLFYSSSTPSVTCADFTDEDAALDALSASPNCYDAPAEACDGGDSVFTPKTDLICKSADGTAVAPNTSDCSPLQDVTIAVTCAAQACTACGVTSKCEATIGSANPTSIDKTKCADECSCGIDSAKPFSVSAGGADYTEITCGDDFVLNIVSYGSGNTVTLPGSSPVAVPGNGPISFAVPKFGAVGDSFTFTFSAGGVVSTKTLSTATGQGCVYKLFSSNVACDATISQVEVENYIKTGTLPTCYTKANNNVCGTLQFTQEAAATCISTVGSVTDATQCTTLSQDVTTVCSTPCNTCGTPALCSITQINSNAIDIITPDQNSRCNVPTCDCSLTLSTPTVNCNGDVTLTIVYPLSTPGHVIILDADGDVAKTTPLTANQNSIVYDNWGLPGTEAKFYLSTSNDAANIITSSLQTLAISTECTYELRAADGSTVCPKTLDVSINNGDVAAFVTAGTLPPCYTVAADSACGAQDFIPATDNLCLQLGTDNLAENSEYCDTLVTQNITFDCKKPCTECGAAPSTCTSTFGTITSPLDVTDFDRCDSFATPDATSCNCIFDTITFTDNNDDEIVPTAFQCSDEININYTFFSSTGGFIIITAGGEKLDEISITAGSSKTTIGSWMYPGTSFSITLADSNKDDLATTTFNIDTANQCSYSWATTSKALCKTVNNAAVEEWIKDVLVIPTCYTITTTDLCGQQTFVADTTVQCLLTTNNALTPAADIKYCGAAIANVDADIDCESSCKNKCDDAQVNATCDITKINNVAPSTSLSADDVTRCASLPESCVCGFNAVPFTKNGVDLTELSCGDLVTIGYTYIGDNGTIQVSNADGIVTTLQITSDKTSVEMPAEWTYLGSSFTFELIEDSTTIATETLDTAANAECTFKWYCDDGVECLVDAALTTAAQEAIAAEYDAPTLGGYIITPTLTTTLCSSSWSVDSVQAPKCLSGSYEADDQTANGPCGGIPQLPQVITVTCTANVGVQSGITCGDDFTLETAIPFVPDNTNSYLRISDQDGAVVGAIGLGQMVDSSVRDQSFIYPGTEFTMDIVMGDYDPKDTTSTPVIITTVDLDTQFDGWTPCNYSYRTAPDTVCHIKPTLLQIVQDETISCWSWTPVKCGDANVEATLDEGDCYYENSSSTWSPITVTSGDFIQTCGDLSDSVTYAAPTCTEKCDTCGVTSCTMEVESNPIVLNTAKCTKDCSCSGSATMDEANDDCKGDVTIVLSPEVTALELAAFEIVDNADVVYETALPATNPIINNSLIIPWTYPLSKGKIIMTPIGDNATPIEISFDFGFTNGECNANWLWFNDEDSTPAETTVIPAATLPAGWAWAAGTVCGSESTIVADYENTADYFCGFITKSSTKRWDSAIITTLPCPEPTAVVATITDCTATCQTCDTPATCTGTWDTITDITFANTSCVALCTCSAGTLSTTVTSLSCGSPIPLTWQFAPTDLISVPQDDVEVEIVDDTDAVLATVTLTGVKINDNTASFLFTQAVKSTVTTVSIRLKEYPTATFDLPIDTDGHCTFARRCSTEDNSDWSTSCPSASPTDAQVIAKTDVSPWVTEDDIDTAECGDVITYTVPYSLCVAIGADGSIFTDDVNQSDCTQTAPSDATYTLSCTDNCNASVCDVSCADAKLGETALDNFTNCGALYTKDCTCGLTLSANVSSFDCGSEVTFTWVWNDDHTSMDTKAVLNIGSEKRDLTNFSTSTSITITIDAAGKAEGDIFTAFISLTEQEPVIKSNEIELTLSSDCTPNWACLDPSDTGKRIDCSSEVFKAEICNVCNPAFTIPAANTGCFTGSVKVADDDVCIDATDLQTVDCTCDLTCTMGSDVKPCDELTWTTATACGEIDTRAITFVNWVTLDGTEVDCTTKEEEVGGKCDVVALTERFTVENLQFCETDAELTAVCRDTSTDLWSTCDDSAFEDCTLFATDATCGKVKTRETTCAVSGEALDSEDVAGVVAVLNGLFDENTYAFTLDVEKLDTDVTNALTALITKCTTTTLDDVEKEHICTCTQGLWCWPSVETEQVPSSDFDSNTDLAICGAIPTTTCPKGCEGATGMPSITRPIYCRQEDGTFVEATIADANGCTVVDTDLSLTCPANVKCIETMTCDALTTPLSNSYTLEQLVGGTTACIGTQYSATCFGKTANTFEQKCPYGSTDTFYTIRQTKCTVLDNTDEENPIQLDNDVIVTGLCGATIEDTQPKYQSGCTSYNSCKPSVEGLTLVTGSATSVQLPTETTINMKYSYIGPLAKPNGDAFTIAYQWAYKVGSTTAADTVIWYSIAPTTTIVQENTTFDWVVKAAEVAFEFGTANSIDIYFRAYVSNNGAVVSSDYSFLSSPINIKRDQTCAAISSQWSGINESCIDTAGVGTIGCTNPATSTATTPTGRCSRTATCDAKTTPAVCQNGGYYPLSTATTCSGTCFCPRGQDPAKSCSECTVAGTCPIGRGVQAENSCLCNTCREGFLQSSNGLCADCAITTTVAFTSPASPLKNVIAIFPTVLDRTADETILHPYLQFKAALLNIVATETNYPLQLIDITSAKLETISGVEKATLTLTFTGDCASLMTTPAAFMVTATASLKDVVANYNTQVTPTVLIASPVVKSYCYNDDTVTSAATASVTPPTLFVPTDPTEPEEPSGPEEPVKEDGGVSIVVIIVPIVVAVVVIIAIILIVYLVCFKNKSSGGSSSSEKATKSSEPKKEKKDKKQSFAQDSAHLELV